LPWKNSRGPTGKTARFFGLDRASRAAAVPLDLSGTTPISVKAPPAKPAFGVNGADGQRLDLRRECTRRR
jgi:hypothetical protein